VWGFAGYITPESGCRARGGPKCAVLLRTFLRDAYIRPCPTGDMPHTPHRSARRAGMPPARFFLAMRLFNVNASLQRPLKGYLLMSKILPRENVQSEMLLTLAGYWRSCAAQSNEPWRSDMMRDTAKEFEKAAAKATSQTPSTLSPYGNSSSTRNARKSH
jgi:hypothetical protein